MASLLFRQPVRTATTSIARHVYSASARRSFQTSMRRMETPTNVLPVKKPVGAFRGGLFGFLLGAVTSGAGIYYYILDEYKVSNELLTEDIYALQAAVQRIEGYVKELESKLDTMKKK